MNTQPKRIPFTGPEKILRQSQASHFRRRAATPLRRESATPGILVGEERNTAEHRPRSLSAAKGGRRTAWETEEGDSLENGRKERPGRPLNKTAWKANERDGLEGHPTGHPR